MNKVSKNDIERIAELKDHLRRKCESLMNAPKKAFFYGIADYVIFVSESNYTHEIITEKILVERDNWSRSIAGLEKPAVKELDKNYGIVRSYIEKNNIKHPLLGSLLEEYEGLVEGRITTSQSIATARFARLRSIIDALYDLPQHKDFVKKYATVTPNGLISEWKLSKAYKIFTEKEARLKSEREISWWWNWNELAVLFQVAYQANETLESMDNESGRWWDMLNFHSLIGDFKKATGDTDDNAQTYFNVSDYQNHLIRVNEFLLDNLQLLVTGVTVSVNGMQEINKPISTISSDYQSKFRFTDQGIFYEDKSILVFPSYQKIRYRDGHEEPIKRRAIIKILFDHREEWVDGNIVREGSPKGYSDLEKSVDAGDIHREMTRIREYFNKSADSAHLELKCFGAKGSRRKFFQLITRTNIA